MTVDHLAKAREQANQAYLIANVAPGDAIRELAHAVEHLVDTALSSAPKPTNRRRRKKRADVDELIELIAEANWRSQVGSQPRWPDDHTMPDLARSRVRDVLNALNDAGWEVVKPDLGWLSADWLAIAQRHPDATRKFTADLIAAANAAEETQ